MSIEVFGSAILRVEPDIAQISFSVSRLKDSPKEAFSSARDAAQSVQKYLNKIKIQEVQASRVHLQQEFAYQNQKNVFVGYRAKISFSVLLYDLNLIEELLIGVVDAGANTIDSNNFQTTRLKEFRAEARKRAVAAAREKALLYCEAVGTSLGAIVAIEDVNPDTLRGYEGHNVREMSNDDEDPGKVFSPSSITVRGAVRLTYSLNS